jgi:aspartyl-tRNA(Asn)/glutamyl-tRNA(Gln) amidotransferase subunit C
MGVGCSLGAHKRYWPTVAAGPPLDRWTETLSAGPEVATHMSETPVDPDEVRHTADLARIDLDEDEVERFTEQFSDVLSYFDTLDDVPEVDAEADLVNVMRADEVRDGLSQEEALRNAPETEDGYFKGPSVS